MLIKMKKGEKNEKNLCNSTCMLNAIFSTCGMRGRHTGTTGWRR
jgi:hypothetical protein